MGGGGSLPIGPLSDQGLWNCLNTPTPFNPSLNSMHIHIFKLVGSQQRILTSTKWHQRSGSHSLVIEQNVSRFNMQDFKQASCCIYLSLSFRCPFFLPSSSVHSSDGLPLSCCLFSFLDQTLIMSNPCSFPSSVSRLSVTCLAFSHCLMRGMRFEIAPCCHSSLKCPGHTDAS